MKKRALIICVLVLFVFITFLNFSSAQNENPGDVAGVIANQFNISKDELPTDSEKLRQEYLKLEWTKIISKNKVLGPIYNFFSKIPNVVYMAILAHPFEISLKFFLILIIWVWLSLRSAKTLQSLGLIKGWKALISGIVFGSIIAQLRIIKIVATFVLDLIFSPENWWLRIIIIVVSLGIFAIAHVLSKMLEKYFKKRKEEKTKSELEQKLKETKGLTEGIKEAEKPT
ncbi:hypothetical protein HYV50_04525 [Candidatus Pacearchaeota archaeon]|nr:hypothetical protein [Candidatus Pacearchaeota archaeon]